MVAQGLDRPHGPGPEGCNLSEESHYQIRNSSKSPEQLSPTSSSSSVSVESSSSDSDSRCSAMESRPISNQNAIERHNTISESEVAAGGRIQVQSPATAAEEIKTKPQFMERSFTNKQSHRESKPAHDAPSTVRKRHRAGAPRTQRRKSTKGAHNPSIINKQSSQRNRKSVRWSEVVQMKDIKFNIEPSERNLSVSEIAGHRLYLEGIERENRLALLRKKYYAERRTNTAAPHESKSIKTCERLYSLSRSKQEIGKKRRKDILTANQKAKEPYAHPTTKISIADATRLYTVGIKQKIALELRRIESAESREYKSNLITTRVIIKN